MRKNFGELLKQLGAVVRARRLRLGLSQAELATRVGLSARTVGLLETGRYNPSVLRMDALSKALELPLPQLMRRVERGLDASSSRGSSRRSP